MPDTTHLLSQFYLKLDGALASDEINNDLLEISIESSLHLPDVAMVTLHDPHLRWVDNDMLAPGKGLQIAARSGQREQTIFDGEIIEIEPEYGEASMRLQIRAFDRLHRLGRGRKVRTFQNMTDGDLIKKLAQEAGLQAKV